MERFQTLDRRRRARKERDATRRQITSPTTDNAPSPEAVFLAWLLWLPEGADVTEAARREIARIERKIPLCPNLIQLRNLFLQTVAANNLNGFPESYR